MFAGIGILQILIFAVVAALVIAGAIYAHYRNEQRRKDLMMLAMRHGWQFSPLNDSGLGDRYPDFACFRRGSNRYAYNRLSGMAGQRPMIGFDYHYETHSTDSKGRQETHHHHFSAVVIDCRLPLKTLSIRPEGFWDKVTELFGFDDIDFESHEFSRTFCVKSPDRRFAFDVFNQATMEFLLGAPRFTMEFAGPHVVAYRGGLFQPNDFEQAVAVMSGVLDRLPEYLIRELKGVS